MNKDTVTAILAFLGLGMIGVGLWLVEPAASFLTIGLLFYWAAIRNNRAETPPQKDEP